MKVYARDMTRSEAKTERFSGVRSDKMLNNYEIWIDGKMVEEVTEAAIQIDPQSIARAYAKAFKLHPDQVILTK